MEVQQPIFVLGTGRCGSTIFHKILAEHPNVAWLSILSDYFPDRPAVNRAFLRLIDVPVIGRFLKSRRGLRPWEPYNFWLQGFQGFKLPCRDLVKEDVSVKTAERMRTVSAAMLSAKRHRFLAKVTGWPRIGFLYEIFPDAKFIHIIRDGRAVVNSMLNVDWWWGWQGPQNWRWGMLSPAHMAEWEQHDRSFVALAAIEWKILMDAAETAKQVLPPENYVEIKYEDLCVDPTAVMQQVLQFCDLPSADGFRRAVQRYQLRNTNHKWQQQLSPHQQCVLNDVLAPYLTRYGYE